MIRRALISVSDKKNISEIAHALHGLGVKIISTGGTAVALQTAGVPVIKISDVTEFPEMMDGRVKTLHPKIHGGLLALRDNPAHQEEAKKHAIEMIDLLVVNLYPFESTVAKPDVKQEEAIENIDIGGPAMIRSASKNYKHVVVLTDPDDYSKVLGEIKSSGDVSEKTRFDLMVKAFEYTARYDGAIANYFGGKRDPDTLPDKINVHLSKIQPLRYGENPHQKASFYSAGGQKNYEQLHGKELSYNNIIDLDACARIVSDFEKPCCVIVKHTNPCGAAIDEDLHRAYSHARETDPVSAFGGVIGFNRTVVAKIAEEIGNVFVEAVLAPEFDADALEILGKKKNIRLIRYHFDASRSASKNFFEIKKALNGYLVQESDDPLVDFSDKDKWRIVTKRQPSSLELEAMIFGWRVVKHVKSNAIVYSTGDRTLGIGAGQMSRVDSAQLAAIKSAHSKLDLRGSAIASDAFFPFRDGVDTAAKAGATAVIQPGGSVKDQEVIDAANEHNLTMIFTSMRHFKH